MAVEFINIPIVEDLSNDPLLEAIQKIDLEKRITAAKTALDAMLLDGWRDVGSMPVMLPNSQSLTIVLFKDTRPKVEIVDADPMTGAGGYININRTIYGESPYEVQRFMLAQVAQHIVPVPDSMLPKEDNQPIRQYGVYHGPTDKDLPECDS